MNTNTGEIMPLAEVELLPDGVRKQFVEVKRDLTKLEEATRQVAKYSPCACGSGKKFKFCCYTGG